MSERTPEERIADLERLVTALTMELRAHSHNCFTGSYRVLFPDRTEIASVRETDGEEMPI